MECLGAEVAWLSALARDTDLRVPRPRLTRGGAPAAEIDLPGLPRPVYVISYGWLDGRMTGDRFTAADAHGMGRIAAALHTHARTYEPPAGFRVRSYDRVFPFSNPDFPFVEPPLLEDPANLPAEHRDVYARALDRTRRALERTWAREPARILHNDLHPWNLITGDEGPALLDFEDIMWGHPVQDIGTLFYYLRLRPNAEALLEGFRTGYEELAPWPEAEPGEIDSYRVGRALYLVNWVIASENPDLKKVAPEFVGRAAPRLEPIGS
jgi:Ser/Thr protein kinase RdoA (MazF antagonist)